jgi:flagellar assembly protein FliH
MSSRLILPGDSRDILPMAWRQVHAAPRPAPSSGTSNSRAAEPAPPPAVDLAHMQREWEQRVAVARAVGGREGEAAGRRSATAEVQVVLERLAHSIDEVASMRSRLRREAEADTVKLAIAIARRVVRRELAVDPEALHGLVLAALEKLQGQEICRVRVHPSQVAAVAALLRKSASGITIEVAPDGSRDLGAVIFETERGNLDASVESQLGEIERGLADTLRRRS